jgi:8-oxo-dGTP diphosphatase
VDVSSRSSREYPSRPLVGVGALIKDDNRILLVRRGRPPGEGEWSIPGGLVKTGETLKRAVVREAREETGLSVEPLALVELVERIFLDDQGRTRHHYVLADYLCRAIGGILQAGSDVTEAEWVQRSELDRYGLAPVTLEVILKSLDMP